MRAGSLNRAVHLLRRLPDTDNGIEEVPGEWGLLGKRRASIKPAQRRETFETLGVEARRVTSLWLRRDSLARSLTAQDAVAIDGVVHELTAEPYEVDDRRAIELLAVAADPVVTVDPDTLTAVVP